MGGRGEQRQEESGRCEDASHGRQPSPAWMVWVRRLAVLAGLALAVVAIVLVLGRDEKPSAGVQLVPTPPADGKFQSVADPFAWNPERSEDFVRRATRGTSHALYANSPGGVLLSAMRTRGGARWSSAPRARRRSIPTCSRASCSSRARGARTR